MGKNKPDRTSRDRSEPNGAKKIPRLPVTPSWIAAVNERLERDPQWSRVALAEAVGMDPSGLSKLLSGTTTTSAWVAPISEALGILPGSLELTDPEDAEAIEIFRGLSPRLRKSVLTTLRGLAGKLADDR
jgi:hypothetical protein